VQLTAVPGVGPKTFEQAAGFLRIRGGDNPLDRTAVHPESYPIVEQIARKLGVGIDELIRQPELLEKIDLSGIAAGVHTLHDILEELRKPGRDPRAQFVTPTFKEGVTGISDLAPGLKLEGVVTNVTRFGAFVDIGVHQDGLVHVSELSNRYVQDPNDVVKVGQIVKVHVLSADPKTQRIALSMKALQEPPPPRAAKPKPKPELSLGQKLSALSDRWKSR
jgi:protein Tex